MGEGSIVHRHGAHLQIVARAEKSQNVLPKLLTPKNEHLCRNQALQPGRALILERNFFDISCACGDGTGCDYKGNEVLALLLHKCELTRNQQCNRC